MERPRAETDRSDVAGEFARPLKIAGVDPELRFAGGQTQVMALTRELRRRGHRAELICDPAGRLWERARAEGFECHPLKIRNAVDLGAALRLRAILHGGGFDIVHFHTSRAHAMAPIVRGCARAAVVTRRMDYAPNRLFAPFLYGREVERVIAISNAVADSLIGAGAPGANISIIPSGVDVERFRRPTLDERAVARRNLHLDDATIAIGAVGALEERKGHRYLLQALAHRNSLKGARCFIAGEGSIRAALEAEAARLGIAERVTMLGRIEDVRETLAAMDIFVMPSLKEGLGVAALEAMASGLAVVLSGVGGLAGLIENETTGLHVPPADADAMAAALERLARDPELRRSLGMRARAAVLAEYSDAVMAERTLEVYRRCIVERSRRLK
jgi:glycosyltransferase involved in cell wall biosynthesis